jgi:hypothetical protein
MELPKKGDIYLCEMLEQPLLIMEVTTLGPLGVAICIDPTTRQRELGKWGNRRVGDPGKYYHLVKDHRGYWTQQAKEGKCPILKQIKEVK